MFVQNKECPSPHSQNPKFVTVPTGDLSVLVRLMFELGRRLQDLHSKSPTKDRAAGHIVEYSYQGLAIPQDLLTLVFLETRHATCYDLHSCKISALLLNISTDLHEFIIHTYLDYITAKCFGFATRR